MPADRLRLQANFSLPALSRFSDSHLEMATTLVAEQKRFPSNADYTAPPQGYVLCDLAFDTQVSLGQQRVRLNLGVRNLFNVSYRDYLSRYRYFIDDTGRDFVLRLHVPFGDHERHALAAR
jgi:iron complex outermembrane receptor protein